MTEESIKKRKETYAKNKHQQGENNFRYGKKAINNDITWKWVQKEEVDEYLSSGWKLCILKTTKEI